MNSEVCAVAGKLWKEAGARMWFSPQRCKWGIVGAVTSSLIVVGSTAFAFGIAALCWSWEIFQASMILISSLWGAVSGGMARCRPQAPAAQLLRTSLSGGSDRLTEHRKSDLGEQDLAR